MSAYRSSPTQENRPGRDVRRLTIARLGGFGIVVWVSFILVGAAVLALALHVGSNDGLGLRAGAMIGGIASALAALFAVTVLLFEPRLTIVAHIEAGTLALEEKARIGRRRVRSYALRDLTGASVEEHGEDQVAAVLHTRNAQIPFFPTRISDDARRAAQLVADAIESWRDFTAHGPAPPADGPPSTS